MIVYSDNKSSIEITHDGYKNNSKHYDTLLLYVQDFINRKEVILEKINTKDNFIDLFSKFCDNTAFYRHFNNLNLQKLE